MSTLNLRRLVLFCNKKLVYSSELGPDTSLAGKCETAPQSVSSKPVSSAPQNGLLLCWNMVTRMSDLEFVHPQRKQILQGALQSTEQQKPPAKQKPRGVLVSPTGLQSSKQVVSKLQFIFSLYLRMLWLTSGKKYKLEQDEKWSLPAWRLSNERSNTE